MDQKIKELKMKIIQLSADPNFKHHKWFVQWHLDIIEKMCSELLQIYPDADYFIVMGLVWVHDYLKILNLNESSITEQKERVVGFLSEFGFENEYILKLVDYWEIMESKLTVDLNLEPIEVKIISSADAASHFIGPFFNLYWYENSDKPMDELMQANMKKLLKDWERKIVLPEVKNAFTKRFEFLKEQSGELPIKYF